MSTTSIELTDEYEEIGTGPAIFEVDGAARVHFGDEKPLAMTDAFHAMNDWQAKYFNYQGSQKVYCRKNTSNDCRVVVTEVR